MAAGKEQRQQLWWGEAPEWPSKVRRDLVSCKGRIGCAVAAAEPCSSACHLFRSGTRLGWLYPGWRYRGMRSSGRRLGGRNDTVHHANDESQVPLRTCFRHSGASPYHGSAGAMAQPITQTTKARSLANLIRPFGSLAPPVHARCQGRWLPGLQK
jgi:hypothetical protein